MKGRRADEKRLHVFYSICRCIMLFVQARYWRAFSLPDIEKHCIIEEIKERMRNNEREEWCKILKNSGENKNAKAVCKHLSLQLPTSDRFPISGNQRSWRKPLVIARLNRDKCWIEERAKDFFGFHFDFLPSHPPAHPSSLYPQPRFPRLFTSGKEAGDDHGTRTGKKWVNYRAISPEK